MSSSLQSAGSLLRRWRNQRGVSQLQLATEANVSARHISFLETGRSSPSRDMIVTLSEALEIPLRERNRILDAAGFAPLYRHTAMSDPALAHIRQAIDLILENQLPAGALAVDWSWNLIQANRSMLALTRYFADPELMTHTPINVMRLVFAPGGLYQHIANWAQVGPVMLDRVRREADHAGRQEVHDLLEELGASPSIDEGWPRGTPQDITLQELRIESFYPMDPESAKALRMLSA